MDQNKDTLKIILEKLSPTNSFILLLMIFFGLGMYYIPIEKFELLIHNIPEFVWKTSFYILIGVIFVRSFCKSIVKHIIYRIDRYKLKDDKFYREKDKHTSTRIEGLEGRMGDIENKIDLVLEHDKQLCETNENVKEMLLLMTKKIIS
jgi:hypothetical protein